MKAPDEAHDRSMSDDIDLEGLNDSQIEGLFMPSPTEDNFEVVDVEVSDPPRFETEEEKESFIRRFIRPKKTFAGLDTSPPDRSTQLMDPDDPFLKMLKPLAASEITMLAADVSNDDTVFHQLERARTSQFRRYSLASALGALCVVLFALSVGVEYITDTLMHPVIPTFMENLPVEPVEAALFAFGVAAPILCGFVIADGMKSLLNLVSTYKVAEILVCVPAAFISLIVFACLRSGEIVSALGFLALYWAIAKIVKKIGGLRG